MTDHWLYFPCRIGDDLAFIFYDHGVRETIDGLSNANLLRVRIALEAPHENGLPTHQESVALTAFEDAFQDIVSRSGGDYVGRVTVAGTREFLSYVTEGESAWVAHLASLPGEHGYPLEVRVEADPAKRGYWDDLFPSDHDWQVIQDLKVIDSLAENGDDLSLARRIDHWATFSDKAKALAFQVWAKGEGFHVESILDPDEDDEAFAVRLYHVGTPRVEEISPVTIRLADAAKERDGEYDGWETSVESAGAND